MTAALSLDATIVLLTPVVFATAARLRVSPRPHVYACAHLANSASLLLPVSNLTNLLAFHASGLSFLHFAALMVLPTLAVIAVEWVVFTRFFATDLRRPHRERAAPEGEPLPRLSLIVVGATLAGFAVSGTRGDRAGLGRARGGGRDHRPRARAAGGRARRRSCARPSRASSSSCSGSA